MLKTASYEHRLNMARALVVMISVAVIMGWALVLTFFVSSAGDKTGAAAVSLQLQETLQALPDRFRKEFQPFSAQLSLQKGFRQFVQSRVDPLAPPSARGAATP